MEKAKIDQQPIVRLLPYFDSFLLGHRSHGNIVDAINKPKIYRAQGWVSPVVLVNGVAQDVRSQVQRKGGELEIVVASFSKKKLSSAVSSQVQEEASDLSLFLGFSGVKIGTCPTPL